MKVNLELEAEEATTLLHILNHVSGPMNSRRAVAETIRIKLLQQGGFDFSFRNDVHGRVEFKEAVG